MRLTEQGLMHTQDGVLETWPEHVLIMIGKQKGLTSRESPTCVGTSDVNSCINGLCYLQ
jgi:hypothetical protein